MATTARTRGSWIVACALACALAPVGCVQFRSIVQDAGELSGTPAFEEIAPTAPGDAMTPFLGVDVEESLAGSLDALEFLAGLRVAAVTAGSPAEAAGVKPNDRLVKADGAEMVRKDQWSAFLAAHHPGDQVTLALERDGGLRDVALTIAARGGAGPATARRFVERRKARVVVETVLATVDGRPQALCEVVELAADSPLREAGLAAGARIAALDGTPLQGAGDFARRVSALPFGRDVELGVVADGRTKTVDVTLFEPRRELTAVRLWPLFGWAEAADGSSSGCEIVDLWLIWLFKYERKGETRAWNILRFIHWESGVGKLSEEPAGSGA